MRPLHVLLLNEYFPPDTAATAKYAQLVAQALAERHQVTVLAGRPAYDPYERHPPYLFRSERMGNLTIQRVGSTAFSRFSMKGRLANYLSYLALSVPRALSMEPDVVLAMTDPPTEGIVGAAVAKFLGRPFVYNIRDLYPDMALAAGILSPGPFTHAWEASHRRALRQAVRVVVLGEDMRERIVEKGIEPSRISVIRDAAPFPELLHPTDPAMLRQIRGEFRFVLIHAGNIGFSGAWQALIHAAQALESEGVGLVFIGEGAMKSRLQEQAQGVGNIQFRPYFPVSDIPAVMAAGDLHVVTIKRGLEGVVVPSKLYNILAYGRPILAVATERAEVARLVRHSDCGIAADPDDTAQIIRGVRLLLEKPERLAHMGCQARKLARTYDRDAELRRFVEIIEQVARPE